ncbi:hypothetical protein J31TS4_12530 [Paenibacillus sp. J31TS4]|uniref:hypothetical protein n=1 Tax=Paenibacillus sp. J31TS4 TaxID=2807195 RepID=UPI001B1318A7|nr:hypothetical protein [Paenibacillus sp. J31TS4]GIP37973.1 hypothetical protein J31TS4_12530 [Paenibacillus sp. J31TS4]
MADIMLRPDMKTPGGEAYDLLIGGRFAGTLLLVYRESDRVAGAVQLDEESVTPYERDQIRSFVQDYVRELADALDAPDSSVILTCSPFVMLEQSEEELDEWVSEGDAAVWEDEDEPVTRIEYQVLDDDDDHVADVAMEVSDREASAIVEWFLLPEEEEIEAITEELVFDCDEEEIDTLTIHHVYGDDLLETIELTHEDLLDDEEYEASEDEEEDSFFYWPEEEYTAVLARDDGDALTFEIYDQAEGGLPIATATVDVGEPRLSGFIELEQTRRTDDAGVIASRILREVEKEQDVESLHLSFLHRNKLIDEIELVNEQVH